jgi:peptidoglycan hydrolase-like protein with peptidoglycan-binding domain
MLRSGSSGEAVEALQRALLADGINPGPIDGIFGPKTEAAVKRFQERAGLEADGIAGPMTMAALEGDAPAAAPKAADSGDEDTGSSGSGTPREAL